jgi:hypothetical protein
MKTNLIILVALLVASVTSAFPANSVPEPETIFYGKVINTSSVQQHQMTSGSFSWSISAGEGEALVLEGTLTPLADGAYSYRLKVPHSALALDLEPGSDAIPLAAADSSHQHLTIMVDGHPATIIVPGGHQFDVTQAARAATYRLDLEVNFAMPDSDGDSLPDWWEDEHGLDKQVDDAGGDLDGDGLSNRAEFLAGSDPASDSRQPQLLTAEILIYAAGTSGVYLQTGDTDSMPVQLVYTLTSAPDWGTLTLRDVVADVEVSDRLLQVGSKFTQADINRGRLVFDPDLDQESIVSTTPKISVSVRDEDPAHPAASGEILLRTYRPDAEILKVGTAAERVALAMGAEPLDGVLPAEEAQVRRFILARDGGYIAWELNGRSRMIDLSAPSSGQEAQDYAEAYGSDRSTLVTGGSAADDLTGGALADILIGGGGDDRLTGGAGPDRFVLLSPDDGVDAITDFNLADGDAIDLSRVLSGSSPLLGNYVRVTATGADLVMALDLDGEGDAFDDLTLILEGAAAPGVNLATLWGGGHLITDGLVLYPQVEIIVGADTASEIGQQPGTFTIRLSAPSPEPLTLAITISGSATNGIDYSLLDPEVIVPAGVSSVELSIVPFTDAITELTEVVQVSLRAGEGYELGEATSAQLGIEDLKPVITVAELVPLGVVSDATPGVFLITRSGMIDHGVFVQFALGGSARAGSDYDPITPFVSFTSGQTSALIAVTPRAGADLPSGAASVRLTLQDDASYKIGDPGSGQIFLVENRSRFADWRDENYPELVGSDLAAFASADSGGTGIDHLSRYAFVLGAKPGRRDHLPRVSLVGGHAQIEFTRLVGAVDLSFTVEVSDDLVRWRPETGALEEIVLGPESNDARRAIYRSVAPLAEGAELFIRVRAIYNENP